MNKTRNIVFAAAVSVAACVFGASSQSAFAPPGVDNFALGYGAGYRSGGANTNVVIVGTDAGMNASNNTDCVFIGKNVGKGVNNVKSCVLIGFDKDTDAENQFCVRDDSVIIGKNLNEGAPRYLESASGVFDICNIITYDQENIHLKKSTFLSGNIGVSGDVTVGGELKFGENASASLPQNTTYGDSNLNYAIMDIIGATFKFENGQFNVYTNNAGIQVKAGTLTFTPAQ